MKWLALISFALAVLLVGVHCTEDEALKDSIQREVRDVSGNSEEHERHRRACPWCVLPGFIRMWEDAGKPGLKPTIKDCLTSQQAAFRKRIEDAKKAAQSAGDEEEDSNLSTEAFEDFADTVAALYEDLKKNSKTMSDAQIKDKILALFG
ncbi:uncharacterized protein LOC135493801 [Lineus longissimus]|uniref:uncharacterized protein LOC135493801 n=1 Tax=Lineus longissimus TaxID=88925 RepID=UPI002B4DBAEE